MEIIFFSFFFFFCCFIIQTHAESLSINYTILRTNLAWNYDMRPVYPVLVNKFTVLANEKFSLAFRPARGSKGKYELGIFMTIDNAEPQITWSAGAIVSETSRLELDSSSGRIILRDRGGNQVWSAGQNVSSWELKSEGSLLLYDANQTVVWNSMDYPTDTAVVGQNFTKLTAGSATAMFENGSFIVNTGSTQSLCQYGTGGVKAQLTSGNIDGNMAIITVYNSASMILHAWNNSGLEAYYIYVTAYSTSVNYSFIRLNEDGSFMLCGVQSGKWLLNHACCSGSEIAPYWCPERNSRPVYILYALVLLMFSLQLLWIFTNRYRLRSILLLAILICSIAATSILLYIQKFYNHYRDFSYYLHFSRISTLFSLPIKSTFVIDLTILQASTIFLLKWMTTSPNISPKIIGTLVLLHMLPTYCSFLTVVPEHWFGRSFHYIFDFGIEYLWLLSFCIYPWPVLNTICLLITRLPGRKPCNRKTQIFYILFLNFFVAPCCAVAAGLYFIIIISRLSSQAPLFFIFIISLNLLSFIFILVSAWAFHIHGYINSILATMQSFKKCIQVTTKRILLWLLLGRRQSKPSDITMSLSSFSYPELEVVTNNFSRMIGRGGFGGVYEGTLLDGKKVAVKKLESCGNSQGLKEFKSEIETLGKIHHIHLVELLGFCAEDSHNLLVYEFMPKGSLEKWIFSDDSILDWRNRMRILLGTAQGLAYLHEECEPRILHLDVKPQNILLDDSFNAKVSDFGLCRLLPGDQTSILLTKMIGTFGYLPPEWDNGIVSEKHDVYSFGVVMLETVSGRKSSGIIALGKDYHQHLLEYVMQGMENGTLIDSRLRMHEGYTEEQSRAVTEIALLCIREDANMRPSMKRVVQLLEGNDDVSAHLDGDGQANDQNTLYPIDEESVLL